MSFKLKELLDEKGYIRGPFGSALRRNELLDEGIPVYEQQNAIYNNREFRYFINNEKYEEMKRFTVRENDLIISCSGTVGRVSVIRKDDPIGIISQALLILRPNTEKVLTDFLFYFFTSRIGYNSIISRSGGSVQANISKRAVIENIDIDVPPLPEQKSIVNILSALDKKIEVNNQINKTLESMAQAIFKQWFVDFEFPNEDGEPYKSSGGEMVESELGMIPKGWEVGSFSDYISSMLGGDWGKDSPQGNFTQKVYCLRGADINDIVAGNKGKMPERYIIEKNLLKKKLNSGNLVVEISGGSPTQSTGRIAYVSNDLLKRYNSPLVATNFCRAIKLKNDEHMEFFYNYWKIFYQNNIFFHYENGTTGIKNLDISSFIERHPIIIPNENIVSMFTRQAKLFYKMHQNYGVENSQIETLRDSLLPKLMSGEIRVHLEEEGDAS